MDLSFAVTLAAIAWLEGLRRLGEQTVVVRKLGFGPWRVASTAPRHRPFQIVSIWPPLTLGVRVAFTTAASRQPIRSCRRRARVRVQRVRRFVISARAASAIGLVLLVLGLPFAASRFGVFGLLVATSVLLLLSLACATLVFAALRALHAPRKQAVRASIPVLSPFTALRSPELILEHALSDAPAFAAAHAMMNGRAFACWVRPFAYDAVHRTPGEAWSTALDRDLGATFAETELARLAHARPDDVPANACYCRRCAQTYRAGTPACADCGGLPLSA